MAAALLPRPTAPMSVDFNETLQYSHKLTGTVLLGKKIRGGGVMWRG